MYKVSAPPGQKFVPPPMYVPSIQLLGVYPSGTVRSLNLVTMSFSEQFSSFQDKISFNKAVLTCGTGSTLEIVPSAFPVHACM